MKNFVVTDEYRNVDEDVRVKNNSDSFRHILKSAIVYGQIIPPHPSQLVWTLIPRTDPEDVPDSNPSNHPAQLIALFTTLAGESFDLTEVIDWFNSTYNNPKGGDVVKTKNRYSLLEDVQHEKLLDGTYEIAEDRFESALFENILIIALVDKDVVALRADHMQWELKINSSNMMPDGPQDLNALFSAKFSTSSFDMKAMHRWFNRSYNHPQDSDETKNVKRNKLLDLVERIHAKHAASANTTRAVVKKWPLAGLFKKKQTSQASTYVQTVVKKI